MYVTVQIDGINLEKLLSEAGRAGILIAGAKRIKPRTVILRVLAGDAGRLRALCERSGWLYAEIKPGLLLRFIRFLKKRPAFPVGMALCLLLVFVSSKMILGIRVLGAGENVAEVQRFLNENGVRPGRFQVAFSLDELRAELAYRLPGLSFVSFRYAGSTLICDCQPAIDGERIAVGGSGQDIVAAQSGIVTSIVVFQGTPMVEPGQAVHKGQLLIAGYERSEKGTQMPVQAQGQVLARVYASGQARVSLKQTHTVETGQTRTRVTIASPWHRRVVRDAEPFASQDISRHIQPVIGLFLPLWREIETYAQTEIFTQERSRTDAASMAQGAAEKIAKEQCPPRALILDKWVKYSMINNEFVYASVVLEYQTSIAGRIK